MALYRYTWPMSEIAKLIDDVIRRDLTQRLKADGYCKSGRTFYSLGESRTTIVNVQASKSNLGEEGTFAINLGVYIPDVAKITNALPFTGRFPKEYDCTIRQRLGMLMTDGKDYWWSVNSTTDIDALAKDVGDAWLQHGKPWIDRLVNLDTVHAELINQHMYFVAAGVSLLLGRRDEAIDLVRMAISRQPLAARRIQDWARQRQLG